MTLATETWAAACCWCSPRMASSAVVRCARGGRRRAARTAESRGPYSRTRCRSWTTKAGWISARQRRRPPVPRGVDLRDVAVGRAPRGARLERLLGQPAQVLDQRQPEHARPRPQLADGERRDRLVAVQEPHELLAVEPAVAVADQLHGHRVDARVAGALARRELGQLAVVAARQVLPHAADLGGDEVVVVEQPLRRRGDELARGARRRPSCGRPRAAPARCRRSAGTVARGARRRRIDGEAGRQRLRSLLEPLDAEQLVAQGSSRGRRHDGAATRASCSPSARREDRRGRGGSHGRLSHASTRCGRPAAAAAVGARATGAVRTARPGGRVLDSHLLLP